MTTSAEALPIISCSNPWYTHIREGRKLVEGRKATKTWSPIKTGDVIRFSLTGGGESDTFTAEVTGVNTYRVGGEVVDPLQEYLEKETLERALPGVSTIEEGKAVYHQWWSQEDIVKHGVLGIQLRVAQG